MGLVDGLSQLRPSRLGFGALSDRAAVKALDAMPILDERGPASQVVGPGLVAGCVPDAELTGHNELAAGDTGWKMG